MWLLFVGRKIMNGRRKRIFFPLASVRCRKENTEVMVNTYGPSLNEQMKRIQEAGCVYIFSGILKD